MGISENESYGSRLWIYEFSVIHPMGIPAFRHTCLAYVVSFGFDLPPTWRSAAGGAEASSSHEAISLADETTAFIAAEDTHQAGLTRDFLGEACAPRTFGDLRNPGLKLSGFEPRGGARCRPRAARRPRTLPR